MTEYEIQCQVMEWARQNRENWPALQWFHCSLNGVKLTPGQAAKAVKSGLKAGIPDLFLPYPVGEYHGLFVELKRPGGVVSNEQQKCLDHLNNNGYKAIVCRGMDDAIGSIILYLEG